MTATQYRLRAKPRHSTIRGNASTSSHGGLPDRGAGRIFWIPLRITPKQKDLWYDLISEDLKAGEIRLQQHRKNWVLSPLSIRSKNQR